MLPLDLLGIIAKLLTVLLQFDFGTLDGLSLFLELVGELGVVGLELGVLLDDLLLIFSSSTLQVLVQEMNLEFQVEVLFRYSVKFLENQKSVLVAGWDQPAITHTASCSRSVRTFPRSTKPPSLWGSIGIGVDMMLLLAMAGGTGVPSP